MNATAQAIAAASAAPLQVRSLTHRYESKVVLDHVDLALEPGSVIGLIGRNGAGKSTLIRAMLGLLEPESGNAFVFDEPALKLSDAAKERLGYVPQQPDALAWLTAAQMFDYLSRFYPRWDHRFVRDTLQRWKIEPDKVMAKLSPGERQRVDLVRALAPQPELLVLDEPASALDPVARRELLHEIALRGRGRRHGVVFHAHRFRSGTRGVGHRVPARRPPADCPVDETKERYARLWLPV